MRTRPETTASAQGTLFSAYRIQSNAENAINLKVPPEALLAALRSAQNAAEAVIKLAKKNGEAVLSLEIVTVSRAENRVLVTHDVRVTVLRPEEIAKMKEPLCPEPDVREPLLLRFDSKLHAFAGAHPAPAAAENPHGCGAHAADVAHHEGAGEQAWRAAHRHRDGRPQCRDPLGQVHHTENG